MKTLVELLSSCFTFGNVRQRRVDGCPLVVRTEGKRFCVQTWPCVFLTTSIHTPVLHGARRPKGTSLVGLQLAHDNHDGHDRKKVQKCGTIKHLQRADSLIF